MSGAAALIAAAAWAGPIKDPSMGIDSGSLSDPLTMSTVFSPDANGGGAFGYYNSTGGFITALVFGTSILPGLTQQQLNGVFSCNDQNTAGHPNPFFLNCAIDYTAATGLLKISFFGVLPEEGDPTDPEIGEHEGIPPLLPTCAGTPDSLDCIQVGHFIVTLNDGYGTDPNGAGDWSTSATPGIFLPGGPTFHVLQIDTGGGTVPEPASAAMVAGALAGLGILAARRRRSVRT